MDTQAFTEARNVVLAYYQGNNYSEKRIKVVRYTMETITRMVMNADIEFDSGFMAKARKVKKHQRIIGLLSGIW